MEDVGQGLWLGSGVSQKINYMASRPLRARLPYFLTQSPKPKAAQHSRMAFLPEKHGPSLKDLAAGDKERLILTGRHPFALQLPNHASAGEICFV